MPDSTPHSSRVTRILERSPSWIFVLFAVASAFSTYFCMYAFRKPFAAARFDGEFFAGSLVALKTAIVVSQILGYACSKYIGIKVCSEISPARRAWSLILLIVWAELALLLFAVLPGSWKVAAIFLNGLPLGMVWGLVVWYLEGRRTSEFLLAGLSCSYILSSGIVKDIGRAVLEGGLAAWWRKVPLAGDLISPWLANVNESWMPFVTGLHFLPLFLLSVWMLNQLPRPTVADVEERTARQPMNAEERMVFIRQFLPGLLMLCVAYFFLTAYRDFRDNYQVELFNDLGYPYAQHKTIISKTETWVAFGIMGALALLNLVRDNRRALITAFAMMSFGLVLLGLGTFLLETRRISGYVWMALTGFGSYLAYVPFGSMLFDRLIAATKTAGTAVFAIYLADAIGYTGSVLVQLFKDLATGNASRLVFFKGFTYAMSVGGAACLMGACVYFAAQARRAQPGAQAP
ncbi:MAG: hypothetical protein FJ404_13090 [Verrucomicrobia bacterium]|nr:hypothetical protein [Verrucomicrobiota bacterium]